MRVQPPDNMTKEEKEKSILSNVAETIMEMPIGYQAGGRDFYLYPPSLGTAFLIEYLMKDDIEGLDMQSGLFAMLKAIRKNKALVVKLAAICSFENRADARKAHLLKAREEEISKVSDDTLMQLILHFTAWNGDVQKFIEYFALDKEEKFIKRCYDAKDKNDGSLVFNGKSVYGTLIDVACERYGWSMDYVVWGVSLNNLRMLMADHITSVFLTKDERQRARVPSDRRTIKMDGNTDKQQLLALLNL